LTDAERNLRPALEHGVVVFGTPVRPPWARLRQVTPASVTRDIFHLTRPDVVLGRETGDIVFSDDEFMSRRHAQIAFRNGRGHLEDLGSSNGTFLRLRGPHGLNSGDLIRMGDELLRFEIG
jgi:pSer/pThr/pTyr-binding forkhead associated (FHA) protein